MLISWDFIKDMRGLVNAKEYLYRLGQTPDQINITVFDAPSACSSAMLSIPTIFA
jgi:hypothetical protein